MRLKSLELIGYKTFADPAEFRFDGGITAIIGPNGSGKSNIADAVRWALGEQAFSLLRAHKTEDMIFSGSERRARMGMAEVTITLDNSTGWLPVEFEEVAVTRRSHRSGENEYLLNGSRVRLRDINDLLGKSGLSKRTYTVIGQGLIDTALSLRPQERRRLIEEAAGLTLYESRRADALERLEETRQNVLRVQDLIAEIEPQVRRLERQAERAEEYGRTRAELDDALRIWYSFRWKRGQEELRRVRSIAAYQHKRLEDRRSAVNDLSAQIATVRARQGALREQLGQWHRESSALHARSEAQQRELAVAEERRRGLIQHRDEIQSEIPPLQAARADALEQIADVEQVLSSLAERLAGEQASVAEAQAALAAWQENVAGLEAARREAQERLLAARTEAAGRESRLAQLAERRTELHQAHGAYTSSVGTLEAKRRKLQGEVANLARKQEVALAALDALAGQRAERERARDALHARQRELEAQRHELNGRMGRLRERYDVLNRMHEEGAGLYEGVRNVVRARDERLNGVVGTVASLIEVPRELETAIEVALGGQLQDVVVERWEDAEAAIDFLKRSRGGRATFLPLDTLRVPRPIRAPQMSGVQGVASELVRCEPPLRPVVDYLLGRTIVCQDLAVARRVVRSLSGGYQIVTPEGEQVRSSGAMTGGARRTGQHGGMLTRERERRELPRQLNTLREQRRLLEDEVEAVSAEETSLQDALSVFEVQRTKLDAARSEYERERAALNQQIERAGSEAEWYASLAADANRELAALDEREEELRQVLAASTSGVAEAEVALAALEGRVAALDAQPLNDQLAARRAEVAATRQEQASKEAALRAYQQSVAGSERQIAHRQQRASELAEHLAQIEERIAALHAQGRDLSERLQVYTGRIEPAEREMGALEGQQVGLETQEEEARIRLQAYESRYNQSQLRVTRQEDQLAHLQSQIEDDLGMVDLEMGEALSGQPLLPIEPFVSSLPEVQALPEGLEEQIHALRRALNRLGAVNPEAPQEYREARERLEFLSTQCEDLAQAAAQLRHVIAELDEVMQREFKATFNAVAREFQTYFARLFNGGSARLELTDPDDLMTTGIDVVARPPGKRQQGLAVLSGGERALTAAALIFAILTVSPTPFCVLDEVDAALDEANVGRFRQVLKELAATTQFVVITHNRYTIEVSDIVYGISMGADGASCVISQRMQGVA